MRHHTRHIIVTGGVVSSLGKGLTAASLGRLLTDRGLRVTMQKLDPYLNVDPGTMNPFEHGEVIARERRGGYLGKTVQVIPHITDEIRDRVIGAGGDIESLPFLEAARQLRHVVGRRNIAFIHVSLVPYLAPSGELKTKPTQHSVATLRSIGIQPDAIVLRCDREVPAGLKEKIALMCDVEKQGVISCADAPSIYDIPGVLHEQGLDTFFSDLLDLPTTEPDFRAWQDLLDRVCHPEGEVTVGIVGKYTDLPDAYLSVVEAVHAAGFHHRVATRIEWINADGDLSLDGVDAVIIPGGFGSRGIEGKIAAITHCRENGIPLLGICLGLQTVVIEAARAAGLTGATSTEIDPDTDTPVIAVMEDQKNIADLGGTMRLGAWPAVLAEGSVVAATYGTTEVAERHRHRYEVNNAYREAITAGSGLVFSGTSPDGQLVEFVEYPDHPYLVATQAHPEYASRPTRAHPLFIGLLAAALD